MGAVRSLLGKIWYRLAAPSVSSPPLNRAGDPTVVGFLRSPSGIGESARLCLGGLRRAGAKAGGLDLSQRYQPHGMLPSPDGEGEGLGLGGPLICHVNPPEWNAMLTYLGRVRIRGRRLIGYWAWELPEMPTRWRPALKQVHEIWVPSRFCAAAVSPFTDLPVKIVPHPVIASGAAPDREAFGISGDQVVFLTVCDLRSSLARKNPMAALRAFRRAFGQSSDHLMICKVGGVRGNEAWFDALTQLAGPNIRLLTDVLPVGRMAALLASADVVVSLHRSEGFGLVPAQAMADGKAVVLTDWSGSRDFTDQDGVAARIPARLIPVEDPQGIYLGKGLKWAEPDEDAAVDWFRRLAADAGLRRDMGQMAAARMRRFADSASWLASMDLSPTETAPGS